MEIGGAELTEVVQTLRRQSERKVREEIVSELRESLERLSQNAREMELCGWPEYERDVMRARLQELAYARWVALGRPGRGISCMWELEYPLPGHAVKLNGIPVRGPVGYAVNCGCDPDRPWHEDWGWSPTIVGAKRLARRHAGLM